jgi:hypothetical protein
MDCSPFVVKTNLNNTQTYHADFVTATKVWKIWFRWAGEKSSSGVTRIEQTSVTNSSSVFGNQIRRVADTDGIRHHRPVFSINETFWWRHRD